MKWEGNRESDNVEDRRGGGGGGLGGRSIGIGSIAIALIASWLFGISPMTVLNLLSGGGAAPQSQQAPAHKPPADDPMAKFVSTVLADTEDVWKAVFTAGGATYTEPKLVLFRGATPTACGQGQAAMGPFYCPSDQKVYIDLGFYETLKSRLGAPGDFAQAYVIAHEVGHHVQNLLGTAGRVATQREHLSEEQGNQLSVRVELHGAPKLLERLLELAIGGEEPGPEKPLDRVPARGLDRAERLGPDRRDGAERCCEGRESQNDEDGTKSHASSEGSKSGATKGKVNRSQVSG